MRNSCIKFLVTAVWAYLLVASTHVPAHAQAQIGGTPTTVGLANGNGTLTIALSSPSVRTGDTITGTLTLKGGTAGQPIPITISQAQIPNVTSAATGTVTLTYPGNVTPGASVTLNVTPGTPAPFSITGVNVSSISPDIVLTAAAATNSPMCTPVNVTVFNITTTMAWSLPTGGGIYNAYSPTNGAFTADMTSDNEAVVLTASATVVPADFTPPTGCTIGVAQSGGASTNPMDGSVMDGFSESFALGTNASSIVWTAAPSSGVNVVQVPATEWSKTTITGNVSDASLDNSPYPYDGTAKVIGKGTTSITTHDDPGITHLNSVVAMDSILDPKTQANIGTVYYPLSVEYISSCFNDWSVLYDPQATTPQGQTGPGAYTLSPATNGGWSVSVQSGSNKTAAQVPITLNEPITGTTCADELNRPASSLPGGYVLSVGKSATLVSLTGWQGPSGLKAQKGSTTRVDLSWNNIAGALSYTIYGAYVSAGGSQPPLSSFVVRGTSKTLVYTDTVIAGSMYYYYVTAVTSSCTTGPGNVANVQM